MALVFIIRLWFYKQVAPLALVVTIKIYDSDKPSKNRVTPTELPPTQLLFYKQSPVKRASYFREINRGENPDCRKDS